MPRENRKDTDKSENLCNKGRYEKPYEKHINLKTSTWYVKEGKACLNKLYLLTFLYIFIL